MPDSVDFPSGTDLVQWTAGNIAANGALSMVAICKPTGDTLNSDYHWMFNLNLLANGAFGIHNAQLKVYDGGTERNSSFSIPALNEWYLIAVTKATGTVTPNFHLYRYSTSAWTHSAGSGTIGNLTTPTGFQAITFPYASGEAFDGNVLMAGVWDSELSNLAIQSLISGTAAWRAAAPDEAWRFDSGSTTSPLTGVSWQTNFPSGDLDVGDAPAGWSDAVTGLQHLGTCGHAHTGTSGNTLTCPATRNIAAGEQLIVALACHNSFATDDEPIVSISDGTANSYSRLYSTEMLNLHDIWFCTTVADVPAGTNIVITLAATTANWRLCRVDAYQGLAASPLDQAASQHLTSTAVADSGFTATTTQAHELIYGFMTCDGSSYIVPAADLRIRQYEFSGQNCVSSDRIVTSTGTYKANGTLQATVGHAEATVLTLKAAELPDSLLFDGANDFIEYTGGGISQTGALTMVAVFKIPSTSGTYDAFLGPGPSAGFAFGLSDDSPTPKGFNYFGDAVELSPTLVFPPSDGWQIMAYSKPDGSGVTSRWHKYVYDTDTWTHENSTSETEPGSEPTTVNIGSAGDNGAKFAGHILIAGWWNSNLSDGTIETLSAGMQAWVDAAPDEAWRLDTTGDISSFAGTAIETARTGTTLDMDVSPEGWADGITFVKDFTENAADVDTVEVPVPVDGCAAGNLVIVAVQSFTDEGVLNTVTDTKGNTYTIRQQRSGSPGLNIAVADSVLDTALVSGDVITATNNDFTSGLAAICLEYSGIAADPFDQTTDNGQFTASHTSGTVTTTQAYELLFGFHMTLTTETWTPTASFSVKDEQNMFGLRFICQDRIVTPIGTYASTGTTGGTENSLSIITTYKAALDEAGYPAGSAAWVTTL